MGTPSNLRSHLAGHMCNGGCFFVQPNGSRIKCAYRSFYASINAPYAHLIHKISFYWTKKHPNACICEIFVVILQRQCERIQIMRPSVIPNTGSMPNYDLGMSASYPTMHLAELENNSLSVEESEQRISQMIHDFYHPKA